MKKLHPLLSIIFLISIGLGQQSDTKESCLNKNIKYYDNGKKWSEIKKLITYDGIKNLFGKVLII
jgi:hypothetical protein